MPEAAAVNIRNRSYSITVEVDIQSEDAAGVLFSHGARFGGHALYVKDRQLRYVYNFVGSNAQTIESTRAIPTGQVLLSSRLRQGRRRHAHHRDAVAVHQRREGRRGPHHDPAGQLLPGRRGLNVGKDPGEAVTDDYPGTNPFPFTGGTISKAIVDVSGEPFIDLEKEAIAMMARE